MGFGCSVPQPFTHRGQSLADARLVTAVTAFFQFGTRAWPSFVDAADGLFTKLAFQCHTADRNRPSALHPTGGSVDDFRQGFGDGSPQAIDLVNRELNPVAVTAGSATDAFRHGFRGSFQMPRPEAMPPSRLGAGLTAFLKFPARAGPPLVDAAGRSHAHLAAQGCAARVSVIGAAQTADATGHGKPQPIRDMATFGLGFQHRKVDPESRTARAAALAFTHGRSRKPRFTADPAAGIPSGPSAHACGFRPRPTPRSAGHRSLQR